MARDLRRLAVEEETGGLRRENRRLRRRLASLERALLRTGGGLRGMLDRRGLRIHRRIPCERLLIAPDLQGEQSDQIYRLLQRYSFRLFLRDVIRWKDGFRPEGIAGYCSPRAVR